MINLGCSQGCLHIVEDAADRHGRLHPCSFLVQTAVRRPGSADEGRTPLTSLFDGGVEALLGELGPHMHASPRGRCLRWAPNPPRPRLQARVTASTGALLVYQGMHLDN